MPIDLYEAKTKLSELVGRAAAGEEIVIAKAGEPKAKLVPLTPRTEPRKPGIWKGRLCIAPDFDAPLPDDIPRRSKGVMKHLLLDTHEFLWWCGGDPGLRGPARAAIAAPDALVYVSIASAWETRSRKGSGD